MPVMRPTRHLLNTLMLGVATMAPSMAGAQTYKDPEAPVEKRAADLVSRMTLDEKIGQLVQRMGGRSKSLNSRLGPEELDKVRRGEVGSYLHVAGADALRELQRVAVEGWTEEARLHAESALAALKPPEEHSEQVDGGDKHGEHDRL